MQTIKKQKYPWLETLSRGHTHYLSNGWSKQQSIRKLAGRKGLKMSLIKSHDLEGNEVLVCKRIM